MSRKIYQKSYYERNKQAIREKQREYKAKLREENPFIDTLRTSRSKWSKAGIPHDITLSDLKVPEFCPYTGLKLEWTKGKWTDATPSIDKIIPELGYVKGNVIVVSHLGNRMKNDASIEQLITFAENVLKIYKK